MIEQFTSWGLVYSINRSRSEERLLASYNRAKNNGLYIPVRKRLLSIVKREEVPMLLVEILNMANGADREFCIGVLSDRRPSDDVVDKLFEIHKSLYGDIAEVCVRTGHPELFDDIKNARITQSSQTPLARSPSERQRRVVSERTAI